jgi:hypothetical protein
MSKITSVSHAGYILKTRALSHDLCYPGGGANCPGPSAQGGPRNFYGAPVIFRAKYFWVFWAKYFCFPGKVQKFGKGGVRNVIIRKINRVPRNKFAPAPRKALVGPGVTP